MQLGGYKELPNDVSCGDILLLDDGRVQLEVLSVSATEVHTKVIIGGPLSNNKESTKKGEVSAAALSDKDKNDIKLAEIKVDYLAVSFPETERT